jgi:photosystem II stability/assembly factor-like uncharacterized protein
MFYPLLAAEWQPVAPFTGKDIGQIQYTSPSECWVTTWNELFYSNDSGFTWRNMPMTLDSGVSIVNTFFLNKETGWLLTSRDSSILSTKNGGLSWRKNTIPSGVGLYDLFFTDSLHGWAGGAKGAFYILTDRKVNTRHHVKDGKFSAPAKHQVRNGAYLLNGQRIPPQALPPARWWRTVVNLFY